MLVDNPPVLMPFALCGSRLFAFAPPGGAGWPGFAGPALPDRVGQIWPRWVPSTLTINAPDIIIHALTLWVGGGYSQPVDPNGVDGFSLLKC